MRKTVLIQIGIEDDHFERRKGGSRVAVGENRDCAQQILRHVDFLPAEAAFVLQGAVEQSQHIFLRQRVQHEHGFSVVAPMRIMLPFST